MDTDGRARNRWFGGVPRARSRDFCRLGEVSYPCSSVFICVSKFLLESAKRTVIRIDAVLSAIAPVAAGNFDPLAIGARAGGTDHASVLDLPAVRV
jgi:hypothetical protein